MNINTKEFSEQFEKAKTVYHYTKFETALNDILPDCMLQLSPLTSAYDPMESEEPTPSFSYYGSPEQNEIIQAKYDATKLVRNVSEYYKRLRQVCFCKNSNEKIDRVHLSPFEPIEHFGFSKPRMWDQYGDKYSGVCIALSRDRLERSLNNSFIKLDVNYTINNLLKTNIDTSGIDLNLVEKIGVEEYLEIKFKSELEKVREKHIDYRDENELKIVIESNNEYEYINIKDSIQAVFCANKLNYKKRVELEKIINRYNIPLIEVNFSREGVNVSQFKKIEIDF
jgi:hypothetical protein